LLLISQLDSLIWLSFDFDFSALKKEDILSKNKMSSVYLQCVGALSLMSGALALRMSMFRLAGSPGEDKPNSPLNNWWLNQTLAAEWNPLVIGLLLALHVRGDNSTASVATAITLTAARFLFASKAFAPKVLAFPLAFGSMVTSYSAVFFLGGKLLLEM
jgi:hypothetical protein